MFSFLISFYFGFCILFLYLGNRRLFIGMKFETSFNKVCKLEKAFLRIIVVFLENVFFILDFNSHKPHLCEGTETTRLWKYLNGMLIHISIKKCYSWEVTIVIKISKRQLLLIWTERLDQKTHSLSRNSCVSDFLSLTWVKR